MREPNSLPQLPIGLAIELVGSYEDRSVFLASAENDDIGWDALVALDLNDMADLKILR